MKRRIVEIAVLIALGLLIIYIASLRDNSPGKELAVIEKSVQPEPKMEYGIVVDSLIIYKDKVKRNQYLSEILLKYGVDYGKIDELAKRSKKVFDVRKIKAGNNYTVLCRNDSAQKALFFIYESSPTSYVVFDLGDSVHIHKGEKEVTVENRKVSGIIESSLWNAMVATNTDPNLANELSDIYAWTIDFFGIQKGDFYKVMYEELYVDGKAIGIGKIDAALFHHSGHDYYAFYFVQDSTGDYFDEEANSLRKTFLKAPLRYKRISSRFSNSRLHPVLKIRRPHHGVDYAAAIGTPVHAVGDGVVIKAGRSGGAGRMVKIKHNGTYTTAYLHLSRYGKGIKKGVHVKQGQVIGYVGQSGLATGPHLDFRFYRNGKAIDPLKVKSPPAKPVDSAYLERYNMVVEKYMKELGTMKVN